MGMSPLRKARNRFVELYYRLRHSVGILGKRFPTIAVRGHIELPPGFSFDEKKSIDRGNKAKSGKYYSKINVLAWREFPAEVKEAINNYDTVIRRYLGDDYLINEGRLWRNYHIPEEDRESELFSQHWHYDQVFDFRNLQLFVLLGVVTESDGPLEYIVGAEETSLLDVFTDEISDDIKPFIKKFVGKRGDTFLYSTGSTPHRAGIPDVGRYRDMFSVAFFPAYSQIGEKSGLLFNDIDC